MPSSRGSATQRRTLLQPPGLLCERLTATPAGSSDVSLPDAARPPPCEPMPSACGPPSPCPTPGNSPPRDDGCPGDRPSTRNLQGPKTEGASEASAIPSDPRPCGQDLLPCPDEWLPHDLSPSLSEAADSDASLGPLAGTVYADCGEALQDSGEVDEHIARHRPAPPTPAGPGPDPAVPLRRRPRTPRTRMHARCAGPATRRRGGCGPTSPGSATSRPRTPPSTSA